MVFGLSIGQIIGIIFLGLGLIVVIKYHQQIRKFIAEVVTELKKVSWTNRKDLLDSTWVVIVSSAFLGLYIAVIDFVLSKFIGLIIK